MKYTMNFGRVSLSARRIKRPGDAFRIAVLGDFSGRANARKIETGQALANRKPRIADVDTLETIFRQWNATLQLPIGADGGVVELKFESLDDFHPDHLYNHLSLFGELSGLRRRLKNSSTFAAAAKEMQTWASLPRPSAGWDAAAKPRGTTIPSGKLSDFARLIGKSTETSTAESSVDALIRQVVGPYVVPAPHPDQGAMIAAVDEALSAAMRRILHHPDFQSLEALWRSVDLMTRELETSSQLQIILYDVTAEEIAADLSATDALETTGLYQLLVEQPAVDSRLGPLSVLVGSFIFEVTPPHAELLGRIGKVAAAAQAPFVAGVSPDCLIKRGPTDVHPLITESWDALRQTPQANYIGLTVPRFMLRWPYGAATEPIDSFEFEEFTPQAGLRGMLWTNGSILAGLLLGKTFSEQGLTGMQLGTVMVLGDVPFYYYIDPDGDQIALPSTERLVSEPVAVHIMSQNFMPVVSIRGRPEVRLGSFRSLNGAQLAGPWAVVEVEPDAPVQFATVQLSSEPSAEGAASGDDVDSQAAEAEKELDALLASLNPASTEAATEAGTAPADATAVGGTAVPDSKTPMDPELADLLDSL